MRSTWSILPDGHSPAKHHLLKLLFIMDRKPGLTHCAFKSIAEWTDLREENSQSKPSQAKACKKALNCAKTLSTPTQENITVYNFRQTSQTMPVTMEAQTWSHASDRHIQPAFQKPQTDAKNSVPHRPLPMFKIPLGNISLSLYKTLHASDVLQAGHKLWQMRDKAELPTWCILNTSIPTPRRATL